MDKRDRDALTQCLARCRAESPGRAAQIDAKLKGEPWDDVAEFAAYCVQSSALNLKPWQSPPCWGGGDDPDPDARRLLQKMLAAGVSRFHPDPVGALEEAKRGQPER